MNKKVDFIFVNGDFIKWDEANTHLLTHTLHYGTGAFEGMRAYHGKIRKPIEHFERLRLSSSHLKIAINYSNNELFEFTSKLLEINNLRDAYIRPLAYKGAETTRLNGECSSNLMIAAWHLGSYFDKNKFDHGLKVIFSDYLKLSNRYAPTGLKITGLYALNLIVKNSVPDGFDDAILLDEDGFVTECTTSNIFMIKNNTIFTPIPDCFLNGITRQTIIQIAIKNSFNVVEKKITKNELLDADEVFICGTAVEIFPITQICEKKFPAGEITKQIQDLYHQEMEIL
jgi:branched-chain amino acid aminotransferase group I